jgi:hypothetical protein
MKQISNVAIIAAVLAVIFATDCASSSPATLNVEGWNFVANLGDEWKLDSSSVPENFDDWADCSDEFEWSGASLDMPLFIPKEPDELSYSGFGGKSGFVSIKVLKIPDESNSMTMEKVLTRAANLEHCYTVGEGEDKDLTFDDKEAHLWTQDEELDGIEYSFGTISVKLSDTEVGVIRVVRWDESDSALDTINSFTIMSV